MRDAIDAAGVNDQALGKRSEIQLFKIALSFLTIFPVKEKLADEKDIGRSARYFPIVGLIFGFFLAAIVYILFLFGAEEVIGITSVIMLVILSRGLHIDGVADTADGLLGGRSKEEAIRIMKDSRIGAFGVVSLILLIAAKIQIINTLAISGVIIPIIILIPVYSRWAAVITASRYATFNNSGLGEAFSNSVGWAELIISSVLVAAISLIFFNVTQVAIIIFFFLLFNHILSALLTRNVKGINGDILGAIIEIQEIAVAVIFLVMMRMV